MKKNIFLLLLALSLAFLANCAKKSDSNPTAEGFDPYTPAAVSGTWKGPIFVPDIIDIEVFLKIVDSGRTYGLYAFADSISFVDTVFIHEGIWTIADTSILLAGTHCEKIVDSLTNVTGPYSCGDPVSGSPFPPGRARRSARYTTAASSTPTGCGARGCLLSSITATAI